MQPGEYTVWIEHSQIGADLLRVSGNGTIGTAFIGPSESTEFSKHGKLYLENVNGIFALKEFDAGTLGKTFSFPVPKNLNVKGVQANTSKSKIEIGVE